MRTGKNVSSAITSFSFVALLILVISYSNAAEWRPESPVEIIAYTGPGGLDRSTGVCA